MTQHVPRKSLGQHFLHDRQVIEHILANFNANPDDVVVEIGPGLGALTFELASRVGQLHAVELDHALFLRLSQEAHRFANLHVHNADALKTDFCALTNRRPIRVIGNLPYNISTPLLFHMINQRHCILDMCFMLQKEVGQRIRAKPGSKLYGRLSVMVQQSCRTVSLLQVGKGAFSPPPAVDSIVLGLFPYQEPPHPVSKPETFEQVVRVAFSQRRKTLRNALKSLLNHEQIASVGVDPTLRPEQLDVGDFVRLSELL